MIKVLIVDDSAFMRNTLSGMISADPGISVVGTARNGLEAVEKVSALKPDVVTMDVEMPVMNGIEALKHIMARHPVPVLMVSSLTTEDAKVTLDALDLGAVDFVSKNLSDLSINIVKIKGILIEKIKAVARNGRVSGRRPPVPSKPLVMPRRGIETVHRKIGVVAIGTSTGGPRALQHILGRIPKDFPVPILIAQHMPAAFTGPFAERLNQLSAIEVKEAEHGEPVRKGVAFIAPGIGHMGVTRRKLTETLITISEDNGTYIYKPSVDMLMLSVVEYYSGQVLGVILTGLGSDGSKGMKEIKNKGGMTIAESRETCVVYGMPRAVVEAGIADKIAPLDEIAGEIINSV